MHNSGTTSNFTLALETGIEKINYANSLHSTIKSLQIKPQTLKKLFGLTRMNGTSVLFPIFQFNKYCCRYHPMQCQLKTNKLEQVILVDLIKGLDHLDGSIRVL